MTFFLAYAVVWLATYQLLGHVHHRRVGGLHFVRLGRLGGSFYVANAS